MDRTLHITMRNDIRETARVSEAISAHLAPFSPSQEASYAVELVLEEVLVNIVRYAYPDGGDHAIDIELSVDRNEARLCIWDDGVAFDPTAQPDPDLESGLMERDIGGLGIFLTKKSCTSVAYQRQEGRNMLELRIPLNSDCTP